MKIAHFGTFDVQNYGDLLFPVLVEEALGDIVDEFVHVSPIGGKPYRDVPASMSYANFARSADDVDAILIGGGNILHSRTTALREYRSVRTHAYPGLWVGAARHAMIRGVPIVVNAPGAPVAFLWPDKHSLKAIVRQAAYFAVRDATSARRVAEATGRDVDVVPDTALRIRRAVPYHGQADLDALDLPVERLEEKAYIAVHINDRYLDGGIEEVAAHLDRLSLRSQLRVCLLGIGPCHDDDQLIERVSNLMTSSPLAFPLPKEVSTVARIIAGSAYYVGSSLHGFISATSYGVPAYLVTPRSKQHKFTGFIEHLTTGQRPFDSWSGFVDEAEAADLDAAHHKAGTEKAEEKLDHHWNLVREALLAGTQGPGGPGFADMPSISLRNRVLAPAQRARQILRTARQP